jgi:hypothetical protein
LTWLYHKWNIPRFTIKGVILANPQFSYPILPPLDLVWKDFSEHLSPTASISEIFDFKKCNAVVSDLCRGNFPNDTGVPCAHEWNHVMRQKYCQSEAVFNATTIADIMRTHKWNQSLPESAGLMKIWNTRQQIMDYHPQGINIFIHEANYPEENPLLHHPLYVQQYAEAADAAGFDYTVVFRVAGGLQHAHNPLHRLKRAKHDTVTLDSNLNMNSITAYQSTTGQPLIHSQGSGDHNPDLLFSYGAKDSHLLFACYVIGLSGCDWNKPASMPSKSVPTLRPVAASTPLTVFTCGGTGNGSMCVFPFQYAGTTYTECTKIFNGNKSWCDTGNGGWGNCECDGSHLYAQRSSPFWRRQWVVQQWIVPLIACAVVSSVALFAIRQRARMADLYYALPCDSRCVSRSLEES